MVDLDGLCRQTFEQQQQRLDVASQVRLRASSSEASNTTQGAARSLRVRLAVMLRRAADRLEPSTFAPGLTR